MLESSIHVKTNQFDGPLGLLLLLIQKEEMDVKSLDINIITKEYLAYLERMRELNFDVAGDYLYMAATLLFLKSKSFVTEDRIKQILGKSSDEDMIFSRSELVRRLEELQRFQKIGELLWTLPKKGHEVFCKPKVNKKAIQNSILIPMDLEKLTTAMIDLIRKEKRKYTLVKRDRITIKEKLIFLKNFLNIDKPTDFETLLEEDNKYQDSRIDNIVITFISLLELARLKKIEVYQNQAYGNIYITVKESLSDFNVDLADGFEEEGTEVPENVILQ